MADEEVPEQASGDDTADTAQTTAQQEPDPQPQQEPDPQPQQPAQDDEGDGLKPDNWYQG